MPVSATIRLPAGWYPDPDGSRRRRWWDGREWTQYTAEFQRPTSVDELDLDPAPAATGTKAGKPARGVRRLRRVETDAIDTVGTTEPDETAAEAKAPRTRATAERLGRWLAGAVHRAPSLKRSGKGRRAHRSQR